MHFIVIRIIYDEIVDHFIGTFLENMKMTLINEKFVIHILIFKKAFQTVGNANNGCLCLILDGFLYFFPIIFCLSKFSIMSLYHF